jgi:predicted ATPase
MDLVRPVAANFAHEVAFRFKHILVRDAAYRATAKKLRALLHEQFADWLEEIVRGRVAEYDEIIGYHLEQSHGYCIELGPADAATEALAERAAEHLTAAGQRARDRGDFSSTAALLSRAVDLYPPGRLDLLPEIGGALYWLGEYARAEETLAEATDAARARGEEAIAQVAILLRAVVSSQTGDPSMPIERVQAIADGAVAVLEDVGSDAQLALALYVAASQRFFLGRTREAAELHKRALEHARKAGTSCVPDSVLKALQRRWPRALRL